MRDGTFRFYGLDATVLFMFMFGEWMCGHWDLHR